MVVRRGGVMTKTTRTCALAGVIVGMLWLVISGLISWPETQKQIVELGPWFSRFWIVSVIVSVSWATWFVMKH